MVHFFENGAVSSFFFPFEALLLFNVDKQQTQALNEWNWRLNNEEKMQPRILKCLQIFLPPSFDDHQCLYNFILPLSPLLRNGNSLVWVLLN